MLASMLVGYAFFINDLQKQVNAEPPKSVKKCVKSETTLTYVCMGVNVGGIPAGPTGCQYLPRSECIEWKEIPNPKYDAWLARQQIRN